MIEVKRVEIRDRSTFIPAIAMLVSGGPEDRLMWRAGFGVQPTVLLIHINSHEAHYDPFSWPGRTMSNAHKWLQDYWDEHRDGAVLDVEYIRGETRVPKESELV